MSEFLLWVAAVASAATAVFTGLLWWVASNTLGGTRDQLKLLREQAEREGRPYVTADVVPGLHGSGSWDLVVENSGKSIALDVRFDFIEWANGGESDRITEGLLGYLRKPLTLVPRSRQRVMWRHELANASGERDGAMGAPEQMNFTVRYSDELGQHYQTMFVFDISALAFAAPAPTEGATTSGSLIPVERTLADIDRALRALNGHVGELRR